MGMVSKLELLKLVRRVRQSEPNDCTVWMERVVLKHDSEVLRSGGNMRFSALLSRADIHFFLIERERGNVN